MATTTPETPTKDEELKEQATPTGIDTNRTFYLVFAIVLLSLYISPLGIALYASIATDGFNSDHVSLKYLGAFLSQPDSTLNNFHKVLFPVILGISAFAFKDNAGGRGVILLLVVLLVALATSIFAGVAFDIPSVVTAMEALTDSPDGKLVKSYFSRTQEVLLMYLMTLIGLKTGTKP